MQFILFAQYVVEHIMDAYFLIFLYYHQIMVLHSLYPFGCNSPSLLIYPPIKKAQSRQKIFATSRLNQSRIFSLTLICTIASMDTTHIV